MSRKLVNCDLCGRDTLNKCRVCSHCSGGNSGPMSDARKNYEEVRRLLYPDDYGRDDEVAKTVSDALDDLIN